MNIQGNGLLATAFRSIGDSTVPGIVFARGVSDSTSTDEGGYHRELELLRAATDLALESGQPIVYFCGAPVYGSFEACRHEDDELRPQTRYGRHQADAERVIRSSGARYLIARTPNVVGPGGHAHQLIPALVRQATSGRVHVQASASRDLLDVDDLVLLTQRLLAQAPSDMVVNVATGISTPITAIVRHIVEILAVEPEVVSQSGGERQLFDVARLDSLVGPLAFDRWYPYRVLDRYVPGLAAHLR